LISERDRPLSLSTNSVQGRDSKFRSTDHTCGRPIREWRVGPQLTPLSSSRRVSGGTTSEHLQCFAAQSGHTCISSICLSRTTGGQISASEELGQRPTGEGEAAGATLRAPGSSQR
jgi:hypothetical protein